MDPVIVIIFILVAVVVGAAVGWLFGSRVAAPVRSELDRVRTEGEVHRASAEEWRGKFNEAVVNLAAESQKATRLPELDAQLGALRADFAAARSEADRLRPIADQVEGHFKELAALRGALAGARSEADRFRPIAEQFEAQSRELAILRAQKEELASTKAAFERGEAERADAHAAQLAQLKELETKVEARFGELAAKAVDGAHERFLAQATERFGHAEKRSEEKLKTLLQPVETSLKRYDEKLDQIEKARNDSYGALRTAVDLLHQGHAQVRDETRNLVNALRSSPKARGRWGEQSLKNVLEQAGLSPFADFQMEVSVDTEDGRLRPDVIVRLPGGRKLIIDAKCSLNAFLDANDATDETTRKAALQAHAASIRNHAQQLGGKNYWDRFGEAADYVVMYIPGEHFLTAALEQDERLWDWAFERRVLLATPINLIGLARTIAMEWRKENLAEQAAEIAKLGKELHARLATMGGHVTKLGRNLELATGAYNAFVGSLESQVLTQARRFEALEVSSGAKEIETLPVVEQAPRPLTKLLPVEEVDAEAAE